MKVRAVEEIKRLGAKLETRLAAAERQMLDDPQVQVLAARPVEDVPARVAETSKGGNRKSPRIEPPVGRPLVERRIAHKVRAVVRAKAERRTARIAVIELGQESDRERRAALERDNSLQFHVTKERGD